MRLDPIRVAVLSVELPGLDGANAPRAAIAACHDHGLDKTSLSLPMCHQRDTRLPSICRPHATTRRPEDGARHAGIGTAIHYPAPVHSQPAYRGRVALEPGGLGESPRAAREMLSLPVFPELGATDVARVIAAVKAALA